MNEELLIEFGEPVWRTRVTVAKPNRATPLLGGDSDSR